MSLQLSWIDPPEGKFAPSEGEIESPEGEIESIEGEIESIEGKLESKEGKIGPARGEAPIRPSGGRGNQGGHPVSSDWYPWKQARGFFIRRLL